MKVCALPSEAFLHVSTGGAYGRQILGSFFSFWPILEVPVGTLLGQIVIKNGVCERVHKLSLFWWRGCARCWHEGGTAVARRWSAAGRLGGGILSEFPRITPQRFYHASARQGLARRIPIAFGLPATVPKSISLCLGDSNCRLRCPLQTTFL